jgi:hypothetical protein
MFNRSNESRVFGVEIDETGRGTLLDMSRWTKFIGVFAIVYCSIMLVVTILLAVTFALNPSVASMMQFPWVVLVLIYLGAIALNIYPIVALLRYSSSIKKAFIGDDKTMLNAAFASLKGLFKYTSIIIIVSVSLSLVIIVFTVISQIQRYG